LGEVLASMKKTFAEFFAGIGLMRMGLELGGWQILFANDIDEQKKAMYSANFPNAERHFLLEMCIRDSTCSSHARVGLLPVAFQRMEVKFFTVAA